MGIFARRWGPVGILEDGENPGNYTFGSHCSAEYYDPQYGWLQIDVTGCGGSVWGSYPLKPGEDRIGFVHHGSGDMHPPQGEGYLERFFRYHEDRSFTVSTDGGTRKIVPENKPQQFGQCLGGPKMRIERLGNCQGKREELPPALRGDKDKFELPWVSCEDVMS
jgi:hypothetical protein